MMELLYFVLRFSKIHFKWTIIVEFELIMKLLCFCTVKWFILEVSSKLNQKDGDILKGSFCTDTEDTVQISSGFALLYSYWWFVQFESKCNGRSLLLFCLVFREYLATVGYELDLVAFR